MYATRDDKDDDWFPFGKTNKIKNRIKNRIKKRFIKGQK